MMGDLKTKGQGRSEQKRKAEGWKQRDRGQRRGRNWLSGQQERMWRKKGLGRGSKETGGLKRRMLEEAPFHPFTKSSPLPPALGAISSCL